jgi:hypothetical protein
MEAERPEAFQGLRQATVQWMAKSTESVECSAEHEGLWISTSINLSGHQAWLRHQKSAASRGTVSAHAKRAPPLVWGNFKNIKTSRQTTYNTLLQTRVVLVV